MSRRLRMLAVTTVAATVLGLSRVGGTYAAYSDTSAVTGGTVGAATLVSPTVASSPCAAANNLLASTVTLRWNGVSPASGVNPPASAYEYAISFYNRSTNAQVGSTTFQAHSGAAGAVQSVQYNTTTLGNLLGLTLFGSYQYQVRVRAHLPGTGWYGATTVSTNFNLTVTLTLATYTCV
ncbi:hypothetical protein AB3X52_13795 [Nocardioides sp. DS6]|uniref:Fibronectin type III domain-containing protein n=1 Tax=Nocardioides eburneus TaxID=3231482 RepID=A0ABV3T0H6_9ACTN